MEVSQYRLATHLVLALLIYASIVWTLRRLARKAPPEATPRLKITARILVGLTFVQLYLGALVAGLRAGLVYNTWPDIDGGFVPDAARLFFERDGGAKSVRQYADGAVRTSHDRLSLVRTGRAARRRCHPRVVPSE